MVTAHRESERKFDVEGATTLPDFARLPQVARVAAPIEETLDATYFDSPDLRLAAAGVTLRRRTGGRDAGWHLKLPAADGARTELRHPLAGPEGTVPDDLARLVRGLVRHAELGPVPAGRRAGPPAGRGRRRSGERGVAGARHERAELA
jgi:inorganic triphosphatase YgiF